MAAVKPHVTTIDGFEYITETLPTTEALNLLQSLGGNLVSGLSSYGKVGDLLMEIGNERELFALLSQPAVSAALLGAVLKNMAPGSLADLAKQCLARTMCNNMKVGNTVVDATPGNVVKNFDEHFRGDLMHLGKVCWWAVVKSLSRP